jgi:uncharacterized membrane protein YhiD involved in acid resistance
MLDSLVANTPPLAHLAQFLWSLLLATVLGAALGVVRPVRREIVPRSAHVIHAQVLLAVVGAIIMIIVAESLARAFAIVGAAGLVRYRARIKDPKDAGVMLIALAVGLAVGAGLSWFAGLATAFVIGVLWVMESIEPPGRARLELTIETKHPHRLQPEVEHALHHKGVVYQLQRASNGALHYRVTVPFDQNIRKLSKLIKDLDTTGRTSVDWDDEVDDADRSEER